MPEKTAAQKRAQKAYMKKFAIAHVRLSHEAYGQVQAHAKAMEESTNHFITRAIEETIRRDNGKSSATKMEE